MNLKEIIKKLKDKYPDKLFSYDNKIKDILYIAVEENDLEYVSLLSKLSEFESANLNCWNKKVPTAIHLAVKNNNPNILALLLKVPYIDLNIKDEQGETPLSLAINKQSNLLIELLLANDHKTLNAVDLGSEIINFIRGPFLKKLLEDNKQCKVQVEFDQQNNLKLSTHIACSRDNRNAKNDAKQMIDQAQELLKNSQINAQSLNITINLKEENRTYTTGGGFDDYFCYYDYNLIFDTEFSELIKHSQQIKQVIAKLCYNSQLFAKHQSDRTAATNFTQQFTFREDFDNFVNAKNILNKLSPELKQNISGYLEPAELINSLNLKEVVEIIQAIKSNQQQASQIVDLVVETSQPNSNDQTHLARLKKERANQNQQNYR